MIEALVNARKNLGAKLIHLPTKIKPAINPKHFLLYNPHNPASKFHFMFCEELKSANLSNYRKISNINDLHGHQVCGFCRNEWNQKFPNEPLPSPFDIEKFFSGCGYHPEAWGRILNKEIFKPGCFFLYSPVWGVPYFHFMKCSEIREKEANGWIKTLRFTPNLSGSFYVYHNGHFERQNLQPCPHCLQEWNGGIGWRNYNNVDDHEKDRIKFRFFIDFFHDCDPNQPELAELYKLMEDNKVWLGADILNNYPQNWLFHVDGHGWSGITTMYRMAKNYKCECCGVNLRNNTRLLVTHHVNGSHPDVSPSNMKVLCRWCHSKQPYHQAINQPDLNILENLWNAQGITPDIREKKLQNFLAGFYNT